MKKLKEINTFLVSKPTVISTILIREGFNGTVVNRALLSLYGGSLKHYAYSPFKRCICICLIREGADIVVSRSLNASHFYTVMSRDQIYV